jgi:hypothetical protein
VLPSETKRLTAPASTRGLLSGSSCLGTDVMTGSFPFQPEDGTSAFGRAETAGAALSTAADVDIMSELARLPHPVERIRLQPRVTAPVLV